LLLSFNTEYFTNNEGKDDNVAAQDVNLEVGFDAQSVLRLASLKKWTVESAIVLWLYNEMSEFDRQGVKNSSKAVSSYQHCREKKREY
jgi:hypothetical protein